MAEYIGLKLVSGDEIFGEVVGEKNSDDGNHTLTLREPHVAMLQPNQSGQMGVMLVPYVVSANQNKQYHVDINMKNVMVVINDYSEEICNNYIQATSNIQTV